MCGIVGIISRVQGGLWGYDLDLFEDALVLDTLRGKDSTGAFTAYRDTTAKAIKHGGVPHLLFRTKYWNDFRGDAVSRGRFVIGHNRAATRGEVNTDNAHPFVEDNIILVHNGTLYSNNDKELTDATCAVDSNAIAHALKDGTPEEVIPKIKGAFALVWYNSETKKLHVVRNDQRPMHIITTASKYFLASEAWMMASAYNRKTSSSEKIQSIIEIDPYDLYTFDLDGRMSVKNLELPRPKVHSSQAASPPTTSVVVTGTTKSQTNSGTDSTDSSTIDQESGEVFPKGSTDKAGSTTPQQGTIRQAVETVQGKSVTTPLTDCALTRQPVGEAIRQATSTRTTENGSTLTLRHTSEKSKRIEEELKPLTVDGVPFGSSTTSEAKQTNSPAAGPDGHMEGLFTKCLPTTLDMAIRAVQKNLADTPMYPQGRVVLLRVNSALHDFKSCPRFEGHILEPGMEMVNVRGFTPNGAKVGDTLTGAIYFCNISVHGPELWVTNTKIAETTQTHRRAMVPSHLWKIANEQCLCDECNNPITLQDKGFTSIARKSIFGKTTSGIPLNVMSVLCADCVEKRLPPGEYLEHFQARRNNIRKAHENARNKTKISDWIGKEGEDPASHPSVSEGIARSIELSRESSPLILLPGTETLQ